MKHLTNNQSKKIGAGSSNDDPSKCDSFKQDLNDALKASANEIGEGATTLADKINALLDKHK